MGLPYNPSSFATNKTILQAIEELKEYLKNNPCYKIYYVNTPYVVGTYTYNLSDVDDPDDTMTEYDVVFFTNSYYAKVIVKDTNTFDIDPAVDFRGATGATGANGVSISGASIDGNGHLILTLSDGSTIDAGEMPSTYNHYVNIISGSSGNLTADEVAKLRYPDSVIIFGNMNSVYHVYHKRELGMGDSLIFDYMSSNDYGTSFGHIEVRNYSPYGWDRFVSSRGLTVASGQIYSAGAASGQVLTANGSDGASWQTPSSEYTHSVSITTTSGTFSDSDFAKLGYGDSTIVYTDTYSVSTVYKLKLETASILEFECIDAASKNNLKLIDVNKSTKAYSMTSIAMIKSATFDSGTATSGKVLTANGSGGTSWETVGGGSTLYKHSFWFSQTNAYTVFVSVITNSSTAWTTVGDFISYLTTNGYDSENNLFVDISGMYKSGTQIYGIYGVYVSSGNKYIKITRLDSLSATFENWNSYFNESISISDKVVAL